MQQFMKEKDVNPLKNMIVPLCQVKLLFFFLISKAKSLASYNVCSYCIIRHLFL